MTKAGVLVFALLVSIAILFGALERAARDYRPKGLARGSAPVQRDWCPEAPCIVP